MEQVKDWMTSPVATLAPEDSLTKAAEKLLGMGLGCIIIESDGQPEGVFAKIDLLRVLTQERSIEHLKLKDVMTDEIIAVEHDAPLDQAIDIMLNKRLRWLPVVDGKTSQLQGLLSLSHVLDKMWKERLIA